MIPIDVVSRKKKRRDVKRREKGRIKRKEEELREREREGEREIGECLDRGEQLERE